MSDDNETISHHIGRAKKFSFLTVDEGQIVSREIRERTGRLDYQLEQSKGQTRHQGDPGKNGCGRHSIEDRRSWLKLIFDCKAVLARGADQRANNGLR